MTTTLDAPVARLGSVHRSFADRLVLDGLDLSVPPGEIVALLGRSGSGKSTALRILAGLDQEVRGRVEVDGPPSVVFQQPHLLPWRSVADNVRHGLDRVPVDKADATERVRSMLVEVGLDDHADSYPGHLSGGQAQRASLARALAAEPRLLLLDEPFSALDALTRRTMHELLLSLWRLHRFGVLLVTHDVDEAVALADRIDVLDSGRVVHSETIERPRSGPGGTRHRTAVLRALGIEPGTTDQEGER